MELIKTLLDGGTPPPFCDTPPPLVVDVEAGKIVTYPKSGVGNDDDDTVRCSSGSITKDEIEAVFTLYRAFEYIKKDPKDTPSPFPLKWFDINWSSSFLLGRYFPVVKMDEKFDVPVFITEAERPSNLSFKAIGRLADTIRLAKKAAPNLFKGTTLTPRVSSPLNTSSDNLEFESTGGSTYGGSTSTLLLNNSDPMIGSGACSVMTEEMKADNINKAISEIVGYERNRYHVNPVSGKAEPNPLALPLTEDELSAMTEHGKAADQDHHQFIVEYKEWVREQDPNREIWLGSAVNYKYAVDVLKDGEPGNEISDAEQMAQLKDGFGPSQVPDDYKDNRGPHSVLGKLRAAEMLAKEEREKAMGGYNPTTIRRTKHSFFPNPIGTKLPDHSYAKKAPVCETVDKENIPPTEVISSKVGLNCIPACVSPMEHYVIGVYSKVKLPSSDRMCHGCRLLFDDEHTYAVHCTEELHISRMKECGSFCTGSIHYDGDTSSEINTEVTGMVLRGDKYFCSICDEIYESFHAYALHSSRYAHHFKLRKIYRTYRYMNN